MSGKPISNFFSEQKGIYTFCETLRDSSSGFLLNDGSFLSFQVLIGNSQVLLQARFCQAIQDETSIPGSLLGGRVAGLSSLTLQIFQDDSSASSSKITAVRRKHCLSPVLPSFIGLPAPRKLLHQGQMLGPDDLLQGVPEQAVLEEMLPGH